MGKRIIITVVCSALGLINASGFARAETLGELQCNVVGPAIQDPIGDKDGHRITTVQFSCFGVEGLMKDALYSGTSITEWDGSKGTYLGAGGSIRTPAGLAVTQIVEGTGSAVMKDGKPAGYESSGKGRFKFASGTLAELSGKAYGWEAKPAGFNRFMLEISTDEDRSTVGTSKE